MFVGLWICVSLPIVDYAKTVRVSDFFNVFFSFSKDLKIAQVVQKLKQF